MSDWEPLERMLMNLRYRDAMGLPFGPLQENEAVDLEDVLVSHIAYMKRVVYGDMTGPYAPTLMANLRAEVATQKGPAVRYPDDVHDVTGVDRSGMERISLLRDAPYQEAVPMDELSVSLPLDADEHARQMYYPDIEYGELPADTEWLSLAKNHIPEAVKEYVKLVETGETTKWCKCPWAVHPDHKDIPAEHCVACGEHKTNQCHVDGPIVLAEVAEKGGHHFKGRGVRRMDTNPICPVHTREGLILGLFEHLFGEDNETPSDSGG